MFLLFAGLELTNTINFFGNASKSTESKEEAQANANKKEEVINSPAVPVNGGSDKEPGNGDNGGQYTPPTNTDAITLEAQQNGTEVIVTTKLRGYSDGTCNMSITNGSRSFSASAEVIFQREFASCAGFSVPVSELGAGSWAVSLQVTAGGATQNKTATVEVQ